MFDTYAATLHITDPGAAADLRDAATRHINAGDTPILVSGAPGTGKDAALRAAITHTGHTLVHISVPATESIAVEHYYRPLIEQAPGQVVLILSDADRGHPTVIEALRGLTTHPKVRATFTVTTTRA